MRTADQFWHEAADFRLSAQRSRSRAGGGRREAAQQATKVKLFTNLKTAKALGLTFPLALLDRADEVIE